MKTTQQKYTEEITLIKEMIDAMESDYYTIPMNEFFERNNVDDYEELSEWLINEDIWDRENDRDCWLTIFG